MGCCPCRPLQQPVWFSYYGPIRQREAAEAINAAVTDHLQEIGATAAIPIRRSVASPLRVPVALSTPPITNLADDTITISFSSSAPGRISLSAETFDYEVGSKTTQVFKRPSDDEFTIKFDFHPVGGVTARIYKVRIGSETAILDDKVVINGVISTISRVYRQQEAEDGDVGFSGGLCLICCSEAATVVAFPCRHCCMCRECSERFATMSSHCPVCRGPVVELIECVTES
jgi:hypothetical protein